MLWATLYKSLFAILRIDTRLAQNNAQIVGTGFIISTDPIYMVTCNHVVGEGTLDNNGTIRYSITKRTDNLKEFDLRNIQISYLAIKKIFYKPEYDLAVLEIDPSVNKDIAEKLGFFPARPLRLDFKDKSREIGSKVQWMSTGVFGDLTLTPRFFTGNLITNYISDHNYKFMNPQGQEQAQIMRGINLFEVDQLFIPGCSGSPVINLKSNSAIGYVHGFKSWPIMTNNSLEYKAEIIENLVSRNVNIKTQVPLVASLSLALDIRTIQKHLIENGFLRKKNKIRKFLNFKWLIGQQKN